MCDFDSTQQGLAGRWRDPAPRSGPEPGPRPGQGSATEPVPHRVPDTGPVPVPVVGYFGWMGVGREGVLYWLVLVAVNRIE